MSSRIAFGTMALTPTYDPGADLSEAEDALHAGLDAGIDTFHTAHHYGNGQALALLDRVLTERGAKRRVRVVAKIDVDADRMDSGPEGLGTTLELLRRDYLDVAQLVGWSPWAAAVVPTTEILDDLEHGGRIRACVERWRREGRVRQVAIEVSTPEEAARAASIAGVDLIACDSSIIRQAVPADLAPPPVREGRMEVLALRPLCGGWLTPRYRTLDDFAPGDRRREWYWRGEMFRAPVVDVLSRHGLELPCAALRFLHQHAAPQIIAVGMRTVAQVRAAVDPGSAVPLPDAVYDRLRTLFEQPVVIELD